MGGPRSGRRPSTTPGCRAGLLLLRWAIEEDRAGRSRALARLAGQIGVSPRTLVRWCAHRAPGEVPDVTQALRIATLTGVPVKSWTEEP